MNFYFVIQNWIKPFELIVFAQVTSQVELKFETRTLLLFRWKLQQSQKYILGAYFTYTMFMNWFIVFHDHFIAKLNLFYSLENPLNFLLKAITTSW